MHVLYITAGKVTFCKAAIINGIKQVSLANSVFSTYPYNASGELKGSLTVIFKLK